MLQDKRQRIFADLVGLQDKGMNTLESRRQIADRYGIEPQELIEIEEEGIEQEWPPLNSSESLSTW